MLHFTKIKAQRYPNIANRNNSCGMNSHMTFK